MSGLLLSFNFLNFNLIIYYYYVNAKVSAFVYRDLDDFAIKLHDLLVKICSLRFMYSISERPTFTFSKGCTDDLKMICLYFFGYLVLMWKRRPSNVLMNKIYLIPNHYFYAFGTDYLSQPDVKNVYVHYLMNTNG